MQREPAAFPPFDAKSKCPMCGETNVSAAYHESGTYRTHHSCSAADETSYPGEHLCRTCTRCRYSWPEATLRVVKL